MYSNANYDALDSAVSSTGAASPELEGKNGIYLHENRFTGGDPEKLGFSPARTSSPEKNYQTRKSERNSKLFDFSGV